MYEMEMWTQCGDVKELTCNDDLTENYQQNVELPSALQSSLVTFCLLFATLLAHSCHSAFSGMKL